MRNKKIQNVEKEESLQQNYVCSSKIWVHHIMVLGRHQNPKPAKKNLKRDLQQKSKIGIFCATVAEINTAG